MEQEEPFDLIGWLSQQKKMLKAEDLAPVLGVKKITIYRWAQKKKLPSLLIENTLRFCPATLSRWARKQHPEFGKARNKDIS